MKQFILLYFLTLAALIACNKNLEKVPKAFKDNEVTPDVVSVPPQKLLDVKYSKSGKEVKLGNELAPKDVREIPDVHYDGESSNFYTLMMVDPDAPSRVKPVSREWKHWLVVNIPGTDVSKGQAIAEYVGSGPPKNTGLHRYVFLLFKQPEKLDFSGEPQRSNTDGNRGKFSAEKFAKKYKLGEAIAGNFFQAQFDDSVPALHKQLGVNKKK